MNLFHLPFAWRKVGTRRFRSKLLRLPKQSTLSSRPRPASGRRKRAFTKPNSRRLPWIFWFWRRRLKTCNSACLAKKLKNKVRRHRRKTAPRLRPPENAVSNRVARDMAAPREPTCRCSPSPRICRNRPSVASVADYRIKPSPHSTKPVR